MRQMQNLFQIWHRSHSTSNPHLKRIIIHEELKTNIHLEHVHFCHPLNSDNGIGIWPSMSEILDKPTRSTSRTCMKLYNMHLVKGNKRLMYHCVQCALCSKWLIGCIYRPESKTIAHNTGINSVKRIITDRSPNSIVIDFQSSFVVQRTSRQPDTWTSYAWIPINMGTILNFHY